jgi:hypothetical protein
MQYNLLFCKGKRPKNTYKLLKEELLDYLKEEVKKQHFPSRREIERRFHLRLGELFSGINELYTRAGLKYEIVANQSIKAEKAELLLRIVLNNLERFGLKLILFREVRERGIDIIASKENEKVGIELKAYNKSEKLKVRDLRQVERFIDKERLDNALIITTTDLHDKELKKSSEVSIIFYSKLTEILGGNYNDLFFIREHSINIEDAQRKIKRQKILDYVLDQYQKYGEKPGYNQILKELHLDVYTYFKDLFEIYKVLKIPPPLKNMPGKNSKVKIPDIECISLWKEEFKKYILEEINKGKRYPSGVEIGKQFGIKNIWNIINVSDLYKELGLKPYLEREKRTTCVQVS